MKNPWKKLSTKTVYQNPWIKVREDTVITPAGKTGIYGVVEPKIAVGILAMTKENEIYLVGQYRYPIDMYSWEIIEGGVELDEDPLEGAKRELAEEANLGARNWEQLGSKIHLSNCFTNEVGYIYLATDLYEAEAEPDDTEVLETKKIPLKDALKMLNSGEITDSLSHIGLLRYALATI